MSGPQLPGILPSGHAWDSVPLVGRDGQPLPSRFFDQLDVRRYDQAAASRRAQRRARLAFGHAGRRGGGAARAAGGACLDSCAKSQSEMASRLAPQVVARVWQDGRVTAALRVPNLACKPPPTPYGRRSVVGVSRRGNTLIQRAVLAKLKADPECHRTTYFWTLTCRWRAHTVESCGGDASAARRRQQGQDREIKRRFASWLAYARQLAPDSFADYVIAWDLQQRGVLHAHMILFDRVPRRAWLKLRRVWADKYGMGGGSVDAKRLWRPRGGAAYLARYIARQHDDETGRRVGRNGLPYERDRFWGNAYAMSARLRALTRPVEERRAAPASPEGRALIAAPRRRHRYVSVQRFEHVRDARAWLSDVLRIATSPPDRVGRTVWDEAEWADECLAVARGQLERVAAVTRAAATTAAEWASGGPVPVALEGSTYELGI